MGRSRSDLSAILHNIIGNNNVYYQPPENFKMNYPCIRYKQSRPSVLNADNQKYRRMQGYEITVIDRNPDSEIPFKIEELSYCELQRNYTSDGLNHWVFALYF